MQISIKNVAEKAGVSAATVSRVLNDKANGQIPPSTRERVRQAATDLGYQPNRFARSLQARETKIIGILIGAIHNPYFANMQEIAEELAAAAGYQVIADSTVFSQRPLERSRFHGWPVDGVLMWGQANTKAGDLLDRRDLPFVYLGYTRHDDADFVGLDRQAGAKALTTHLLDRGYRRITYAVPHSDPNILNGDDRAIGYFEAMDDAGLARRIQVLEVSKTPAISRGMGGRRADGFATALAIARMPAGERPDAVFCYNDLVALGMREGLRSCGLSVPADVAIAGCDGLEEGLFLAEPLTTIETPVEQMCDTAVRYLVRRLVEGSDIPPQQIVLPTTLRIGGTT
ncbi:MAG: LacI family DNA-binding transcriptional regulator [Capsulimonadaceae bacterium]|nr:LacI family DNA-binding transcriptional regulator [Capsulimonadaceae bacterium]